MPYMSFVKKINTHFSMARGPSISLLDLSGFENFTNNSFDQFFINASNERLQQYFMEYIFPREQREYDIEGIEWRNIMYHSNDDVLDLLFKVIEYDVRRLQNIETSLTLSRHLRSIPSFWWCSFCSVIGFMNCFVYYCLSVRLFFAMALSVYFLLVSLNVPLISFFITLLLLFMLMFYTSLFD